MSKWSLALLAPLVGFFSYALELIASLLVVHELALVFAFWVFIALDPIASFWVFNLSAIVHRTFAGTFSGVLSHCYSPLGVYA